MDPITHDEFIYSLLRINENEIISRISQDHSFEFSTMVKKYGTPKNNKIKKKSRFMQCQALTWGNGEYPQCSRNSTNTGDYPIFCKTHANQIIKNGSLTNGRVGCPPPKAIKIAERKKKQLKKKEKEGFPKRGMPAFMCFSNEKRSLIKQQNPNMKFVDVAKLLGNMWKKLSSDEKQIYFEISRKDHIRYNEEKQIYEKNKPPKIKRAKSPYIFFTLEKREDIKSENQDLSFGEITRKLAELWKNMDENQKQKYVEMSNEDKLRYKQEKNNETNPET